MADASDNDDDDDDDDVPLSDVFVLFVRWCPFQDTLLDLILICKLCRNKCQTMMTKL